MTDLLIHCGLHKTGSSAFQIWAMRHAAALEAEGLAMPTDLVGPLGNGVVLAQRALTKPVATLTPDEAELRANFIAFCKATKGDVLLSAEAFEGEFTCGVKGFDLPAMLGEQAVARLGPKAETIRQNIRCLRALATEAGITRIRLCFVLRNMADKQSSGFAQRCKQLIQKEAVFGPVVNGGGFKPVALCLRLLQEEGVEVTLGVAGSHAGGIVGLVLDRLGVLDRLAGKVDVAVEVVNASIGEIGVVCALRLIAALRANGLDDRALRFRLADLLQQACAGIEDRPFQGFSSKDLAKFQRQQALLDAQLSPWLSPAEIARLGKSRAKGGPSPLTLDDLSPAQAVTARRILQQIEAHIPASNLRLAEKETA